MSHGRRKEREGETGLYNPLILQTQLPSDSDPFKGYSVQVIFQWRIFVVNKIITRRKGCDDIAAEFKLLAYRLIFIP